MGAERELGERQVPMSLEQGQMPVPVQVRELGADAGVDAKEVKPLAPISSLTAYDSNLIQLAVPCAVLAVCTWYVFSRFV